MPELTFPQLTALLEKSFQGKKPYTRLRTLMVIHYLISHSKCEGITAWFHTKNFTFEYLPSFALASVSGPYCNYLRLRSKHSGTIQTFLNANALQTIKQNISELFQKTDEVVLLAEALTAMKDILVPLVKHKKPNDICPEIVSYVLADSEMVYQAVKSAVGCLWQNFSSLDSYASNRAREIFIRYNNFVKALKEFAGTCLEEYPGAIPEFSALSDKTMQVVNSQVLGKENLRITANLINFEPVERDGSPKKSHTRVLSNDTTAVYPNIVYSMPYPQGVYYQQPYFYSHFPMNNFK